MPVDPGNLVLLGRLNDTPKDCRARSPAFNGFDHVLRRLWHVQVDADVLMGMGVGGLLKEWWATQPAQQGRSRPGRKGPESGGFNSRGRTVPTDGGPEQIISNIGRRSYVDAYTSHSGSGRT